MSDEGTETEFGEAPIKIVMGRGKWAVSVDGQLIRELLGLVRDVRKALSTGTLIYGPRGTEIRGNS